MKYSHKKYRLDELIVLKNLVDSRIKAQKLILDGKVKVENNIVYKPSKKFPIESKLEIQINNQEEFVSRGGKKLNKAIQEFSKYGLEVENKICLDIGASTGGFTDCLLKHKAQLVIALDNGKNQLHPQIAQNPKVINIEQFNAKNINTLFENPLKFNIHPEILTNIDIITIDVSFISATLITSSLRLIKNPKTINLIILIKPNFELTKKEKKYLKKGVIKDRKKIILTLLKTLKIIKNQGFKFIKVIESPIKGDKGNTEFLAYFIKEKCEY